MPNGMENLAASLLTLLVQLWHIFYFIVLPMLLLAGIGWLLQRKMGLDMPTLTRLNFYFVTPGLIYTSVVNSRLEAAAVWSVALFGLAVLAAIGIVTYLVALARRVSPDHRTAMLMTTMFNNSGNYALPLQDLAFRSSGRSAEAMLLQVVFMLVQNISNFTVGILLAAGGNKDRHWKQNLLHIAKFPPIYTLAAALLTVEVRTWLGNDAPRVAEALRPFWQVILYVREAFIAVALCTLGAQLATVRHGGRGYPVKLSVALRLLVAPALGLLIIYAMGIRGFTAQVVLISTATPTAVNSMLLCLEFGNHPDYVARAVFYSTLLSPITVTLVVFLVQGGFLSAFAL